MPTNVEIKARVPEPEALRRRVDELCDAPPRVLLQEDVFFHAPRGRLKLRLLDDWTGELIFYEREDATGPRPSRYQVVRTGDPLPLRSLLEAALGGAGVVRKRRALYRYGRTRIHLDQVEGLGAFIEMEVMLESDQEQTEARRIVTDLMTRLGVSEADLVSEAYIDLLQRRGG